MVIEKYNAINCFSSENLFGCSVLEINTQREVSKERQAKRCSFDKSIVDASTNVFV